MIDRYQLRYFLAVVDAGNFSRAAVKMSVTQPTLSVGVAKLEQHLGTPLFFRNNRRVQLTEAGIRFLEHARAIEQEFNALERGVGKLKSNRLIRLGVLTTIPTAQVARIVEHHRETPDADRLEIVEGTERDLIGRLERGRIDLALMILRPEPARFVQEPLYSEGYALAVPLDHRHAQAAVVEPEDLADEVMIVRRDCEVLSITSRYFTDRGVRPEFSFRSASDDKVLAMVRAGLGITVMPESYADPGVRRPRLSGFNHRRQIGMVFTDAALALKDDGAAVVGAIRATLGQAIAGRGDAG